MDLTQFISSTRAACSILFNTNYYGYLPINIVHNLDIKYPIDYYFDYTPKLNHTGRFDDDGIILWFMNKHDGYVYDPVQIMNYAFGAYQFYKQTGDEQYKNIFFNYCDWLCNNQSDSALSEGAWLHKHTFNHRNTSQNWISGLAQGKGISLLLRAWKESGDNKYLYASESAFKSLTLKLCDNGLMAFVNDSPFFEEYPSDPASNVLNGHIYALLGIRDLYLFTGNETAKHYWENGIKALPEQLLLFDTGYWSLYELLDGISVASMFYHTFHITLIELLYRISGDPKFATIRDRFQLYLDTSANRRKAFVKKAIWRLKRL